jgi:hypothetical protein
LNTAMYRCRRNSFASSSFVIPASRNSCGNRPCHVPNCVRCAHAPGASRPESSARPTPSWLALPASAGACPLFTGLGCHKKMTPPVAVESTE